MKIRNATEHHPEVQAILRSFCLYQFSPFEILPLLINFFVIKFFNKGGPEWNLPCHNDFLYWFLGDYNLKMSKIGRQLTFPLSRDFLLFLVFIRSKPPLLHREVSQESLYQMWRKPAPPPQNQKMVIFYTSSCQTEVGGHIVYVMGIPHNTCSSAILFSISSIIYYCRIQSTILS